VELKKTNRQKIAMAENDLSNIWLSEKSGVSQATVSKMMATINLS